jgi:capsular exopolysaccharide synthesis family protein
MSRIHEALTRAQKLDSVEEGQAETNRHDDAVLSAPPEWTVEPTPQPRPAVRVAVERALATVSGSNGHDRSNGWSFNAKLMEKLVVGHGVDSAALEQYRRMAGLLHLTQCERGEASAKIVMVSSALSAEGKSLTCVNLALTLSESYHRNVLVVDGDLRRPWLHEVFQVPNIGGLNDALTAPEGKIPVQQVSERLSILTAGSPAADPMRVLSSVRMDHVLQQARSRFDWVLLDTPPVTLLTDASLLASKADLVILVVHAEKTDFEVVQRAIDEVGRERIAGVVLNRARGTTAPSVYLKSEHHNNDHSSRREE